MRRHNLLVLGLATTFPVGMFAQPAPGFCQGLAGTWFDDYGFQWTLQQSGFQGTTISGTVLASDDCASNVLWDVTGSMDEVGDFSLDATYDPSNPPPPPCLAHTFSYYGSLSGAGCEYGNGNWTNDAGFGDVWNWWKNCDAPTDEITSYTYNGFAQVGSAYNWTETVVSNLGFTFGGRPAYESDSGAYVPFDSCYFQNSLIKANSGIPYTPFQIDWNQQYGDLVGWTAEATVYYRDQRAARGLPMPCSYLSYQDVSVRCQMPLGGSSIPYKTRIPHEGVIGVTTVESWRNGLLAAQTWP